MVFDCDSREAVELAAGACGGNGPVPPPNFASARKASGHLQVGYFLARPVYRGDNARAHPLAFLGRVSEYYRAALGADPGFRRRAVLAIRCTAITPRPIHAFDALLPSRARVRSFLEFWRRSHGRYDGSRAEFGLFSGRYASAV